MKKSVLFIAVVFIFAACQNKSSIETKVKTYTIAELTSAAAELDGESVTLEGMVTHVCKHGGQKMFISDSTDEQTVLIRVGSSIPEFDVALEGSQVEIRGIIEIVPEVANTEGEDHDHEGEMAEDCEQAASEDGEDCVTEEEHDKKNQEKKTIKFHVKADSFKELVH